MNNAHTLRKIIDELAALRPPEISEADFRAGMIDHVSALAKIMLKEADSQTSQRQTSTPRTSSGLGLK